MTLTEHLKPMHEDTSNGYQFEVIIHCSSFDKEEIENLYKSFQSQIGDGSVIKYEVKEQ